MIHARDMIFRQYKNISNEKCTSPSPYILSSMAWRQLPSAISCMFSQKRFIHIH